jgi:hypothetical protein
MKTEENIPASRDIEYVYIKFGLSCPLTYSGQTVSRGGPFFKIERMPFANTPLKRNAT